MSMMMTMMMMTSESLVSTPFHCLSPLFASRRFAVWARCYVRDKAQYSACDASVIDSPKRIGNAAKSDDEAPQVNNSISCRSIQIAYAQTLHHFDLLWICWRFVVQLVNLWYQIYTTAYLDKSRCCGLVYTHIVVQQCTIDRSNGMSITGLEYFVSRRLSTDTTPGQKVSERTLEIDTDLIHPWVGLGWVDLLATVVGWV